MKKILSLFLLLLTSCSTWNTKQQLANLKYWESKAVIKDLKQDKTHTIDIDIYNLGDQKIRLDISALMGVSVAHVVVNDKKVFYTLDRQSQYFQGNVDENSFQYLMNIPLHPWALIAVIQNKNLSQFGWQCTLDGGIVQECLYPKRHLTVKYQKFDSQKFKIQILGPQFEMNWLLTPSKTEVQNITELFRLNAPGGFHIIEIN